MLSSEVGDLLPTQGTTVLAFPDPLLDALSVEDVLLVAVKRRDKVVAQEVAPTDGALPPQTTHTFIKPAFLLLLCLLVLEL